ncbi:MAG: nucleoside-diphosphate sugar epimerase/dehydratase [Spirochaetales bacterium]|uniref:Nucleoside-diphosphate sugar epimerase/dehydratase n=1 Tax=Candidatus Thalassospirochaeta sargassi TaxID=3119039 RepID=A0AAJ1IHS6_9SPIO|nr:nucleoside-diphosphate sugar epimerase/dehydratase [Spirochaetales bacterium]
MESKNTRIYIIGAGFAGQEIANELTRKGIFGTVIGFIDDDPGKIGTSIDGIPVFGPITDMDKIQNTEPADEAIIAIPGAPGDTLKRIYSILKDTKLGTIRLLPGISQIIEGDAHLIQTREIAAEDLIGRDSAIISLKESLSYLRGRRVLITGAGGSIGGELSRQLLSGGAQRLYLLDHGENSLYEIEAELKLLQEEGVGEAAAIVPVVGDLQDREYMHFILSRLKADVIFHCAAYKHVPMMEMNPVEAVKNNVFGTRNLVDAAKSSGVSKFVLISTDKAVEPVSIYGSSKMIAEEIVLSGNSPDTEMMAVRFGNVLGSRGSIVPLFQKQISKGGPVTITHPDIKRYFMTIPEAASLVLKAGGVGEGGVLYLLDMGDPIIIRDLAEQMINFYGYRPGMDIPIVTIGLRPGEKLEEKLWSSDENPQPTGNPGIIKLEKEEKFSGGVQPLLDKLSEICFFNESNSESYRNRRKLRNTLKEYIPELEIPENEPEY